MTKETYQRNNRVCFLLCNSKDCSNEKEQIEVLQCANTTPAMIYIFINHLKGRNGCVYYFKEGINYYVV